MPRKSKLKADNIRYRSIRQVSPLHQHFHEHTYSSKVASQVASIQEYFESIVIKEPASKKCTMSCTYLVILHINRAHALIPYVLQGHKNSQPLPRKQIDSATMSQARRFHFMKFLLEFCPSSLHQEAKQSYATTQNSSTGTC
jgi:hypothetical protein